jgi:hypothetical protein
MSKKKEVPLPRTSSRTLMVISRIASFIFHPLFMTLLAAVICRFAPGTLVAGEFKKWINQLLLYTVLLPFASILLLRLSGLISNARMHEARDRILPLIATMIFYIFTYCLFVKQSAPLVLRSLLLGSSCAILAIFIVNIFYKVSVHTTAAAILPGISMVLMLKDEINGILFLSLALLIALVVGVVRWLLGAHTIGQIVLGYIIGIVMQLAAYFISNPGKF